MDSRATVVRILEMIRGDNLNHRVHCCTVAIATASEVLFTRVLDEEDHHDAIKVQEEVTKLLGWGFQQSGLDCKCTSSLLEPTVTGTLRTSD